MRPQAPLLLCIALLWLCAGGGAADHAVAAERAAAAGGAATVERAAAGADAAAQPDPAVMRKWSRSCALCHVDGNAGAPRIGHVDEWRPRLAQGRDVLLDHTLEGFNKMPPLGYCMSCEADDFRALIDFMAGAPQ